MVVVSQLVRGVDLLEMNPLRVYDAFRGRNTYMLESAEGGEKVARFSFIGLNPAAVLKIKNGKVGFRAYDPLLRGLSTDGDNPIEILRRLMRQFRLKDMMSPARFDGGFVGYFAYDLVRYFVDVPDSEAEDVLKVPDAEFVLAKNNIIFDHVAGKTYVTSNLFSGCDVEKEKDGLDRIVDLLLDLEIKPQVLKPQDHEGISFESNLTRREFTEGVGKAREYIKAGDIFQVVLSQCLSAGFNGDAFKVYQALKSINPSPYMYYLDFPDRTVVGSSPEMLARVEGLRVLTYPIAGTRPRGKTVREDMKLEAEMLSDEKERAEHVMLVDLGRNDIGRVAEYGSVKVEKFMGVEKYSHVQHIVSEVAGTLKRGKDAFDALQSIFPAGTVSGAPKVRAMEIIDELEPTRRGVYAGCVGYFSFNRNMDTAITIRTLVFEKKEGRVYAQAGAGIVADSKPESEFNETLNKAKALLKALSVS